MTTDINIQEKEKFRVHTALVKAAVNYIVASKEKLRVYNTLKNQPSCS
jgi:hypothetical protein